ncbi:Ger(x)C family spore germination protein [Paenibacillus filicis]|uniref:Ger(X)C family spore germination protein n=1 Tax=Paenibacillus filicis TaxID=669464 RepID=A0ABU9DVG1_9BACL
MTYSMLIRTCALIVLTLLATSGCSTVKQINRISFVTAVGIDKTEAGVRVYALAAVPGRFMSLAPGGAAGQSESPNFMIEQEGTSVSDALYRMKLKSARDLQFGHVKTIVFSDEAARGGLDEHLDLFMRRSEFQPTAWVAISEGSAKKLLLQQPEVPESISDLFVDIFSQVGSDSFEILPVYLYNLYGLTGENAQNGYAPLLQTIQKDNHVGVQGTALFRQDRMIGQLSPEETLTLQMLQGQKLKPASFVLDKKTVYLMNYKVKRQVGEGKLLVQFSLGLELDQSQGKPIGTLKDLRALEEETGKLVQKQTAQLIKKLQSLKSDPVGFAADYRKSHHLPRLDMEPWLDDLFPTLQPEVTVQATLLRRGTIQ